MLLDWLISSAASNSPHSITTSVRRGPALFGVAQGRDGVEFLLVLARVAELPEKPRVFGARELLVLVFLDILAPVIQCGYRHGALVEAGLEGRGGDRQVSSEGRSHESHTAVIDEPHVNDSLRG